MTDPLNLNIHDAEDLSVLSAAMQDFILRVADMIFLPKRRRFALVGNRFKWEEVSKVGAQAEEGQQLYHRVRTGIHFDGVMAVKTSNIQLGRSEAILDLLALTYDSKEDGMGEITLVFAGGGAILLGVECIDASLSDMGQPWVTPRKPEHGITDDLT